MFHSKVPVSEIVNPTKMGGPHLKSCPLLIGIPRLAQREGRSGRVRQVQVTSYRQ